MKPMITLNIEFTPVQYAYLKAFIDCQPDWDVDRVLSTSLSKFLEIEAAKNLTQETSVPSLQANEV